MGGAFQVEQTAQKGPWGKDFGIPIGSSLLLAHAETKTENKHTSGTEMNCEMFKSTGSRTLITLWVRWLQ
jgi:hypothetical protein